MKTQHEKILEMHQAQEWVCQMSYWNAMIRSPHKRRSELARKGYMVENRPCVHGHDKSYDYRITKPINDSRGIARASKTHQWTTKMPTEQISLFK